MCIQSTKGGNRSDIYINSLLSELLVQSHCVEKNLPSFELLDKAFSLFNEEVGEMSFSVLARLIYSKSHEVNLGVVNQLYCLVHEYAALDDDIMADQDHRAMRNGYTKVDFHGPASEAVGGFLRTMMRKLRFNQFEIYSGKAQFDNPVFNPSREVPLGKWVQRPLRPQLWLDDLNPALEIAFTKLKASVRKPLSGLYANWPEFESMPDPEQPVVFNNVNQFMGLNDRPMEVPLDKSNMSGSDTAENDEGDSTTDEERPLRDPLVQRQDRFEAMLARFPSKKGRPAAVGQTVWVIDIPEPDESIEDWKIVQVKVLPSAVRGKKKKAKGTPYMHRRVEYDDGNGPVQYDYHFDNIDVSLSKAHERRNDILRALGIKVYGEDEKQPQNAPVQFVEDRLHRIHAIGMAWEAMNGGREVE